MEAIRAVEHRERSGWWPDLTLILVLVCLYFFSFPPGSPVFGPSELFKQDTIHIKKHLIINKPYRWNPQHHLLYHVMVEGGYSALVHLGLKHNALGVHYYLKGFTASTGLGFLLLLAALMRQLGLTTVRRLVALLFTGVSVTAWFHFSVFETHSLAAIPVILYWLCLFNILRRPEPRPAAYLLLALSLAVAALARFDQFRMLVLTLPLLLLPALKGSGFAWRPP